MYEQIPFSSLVKINPPLDRTLPSPSAEVSFISMQDVTNSGDWSHRQSRPLQSIGSGYTPFQEDDVLFAKITPCMENGKGAHATELLNGLGFGSTEFHVLRAVNDTSSRFVFHVCNSRRFRQSAEVQMTGSAGQKRVPAEFFSRFFVPRFSRKEQRAIATVLDSMDEAIRRTETVIAKLRQVKTGMLHDLLTRGLNENGALRDPIRHPEQFKDSPLGRIPKEWSIYNFGNICEKIQDGTHFSPVTTFGPYLYITSKNIRFGYMDLSGAGRISKEEHEQIYRRCDVRKGDVLITKDGANTGNAAINEIEEKFSLLSSVAVLRCDEIKLHNNFLLQSLLSPMFQKEIQDAMSGNAITRLTLNKINNFKIALPCYKEQRRISNSLNTLHAVLTYEEINCQKNKITKQGLMHDLLTGRVRVPLHLLEAMP